MRCGDDDQTTRSTEMEIVFRRLESWGFPRAGTDWLRRRRLVTILVLAILAWALFIAVGVVAFRLIFG